MNKTKYLHLAKTVFKWLLAASLAVSSACLIIACVSIYLSGDKPFSRETVALAFAPISIPVYISIALVIADIILSLFSAKAKEKVLIDTKSEMYVSRLSSTKDLSSADDGKKAAVYKENKKRKTLFISAICVCVICAVPFLIFALNGENFHKSEINASMIASMTILLPCYLVATAYAIISGYISRASVAREAEILKVLPTVKKEAATTAKKVNIKLIAIITFIVCAIALITVGAFTGGTADVLTKAVNICTECIGLG